MRVVEDLLLRWFFRYRCPRPRCPAARFLRAVLTFLYLEILSEIVAPFTVHLSPYKSKYLAGRRLRRLECGGPMSSSRVAERSSGGWVVAEGMSRNWVVGLLRFKLN